MKILTLKRVHKAIHVPGAGLPGDAAAVAADRAVVGVVQAVAPAGAVAAAPAGVAADL